MPSVSPQPVSINVKTFGTAKIEDARIIQLINEVFDLRPKAIIQQLDLLRPIYQTTQHTAILAENVQNLPGKRQIRLMN